MHFADADDMEVAAHRWSAAILAGVLGRSAARSPAFAAVAWDGAREVTVTTAPGVGRLASGPAGGFTVSVAGVPVAIESASVDAGGVVRLRLVETPASPPTVSLGSGRSGAGAPVPVESSAWRLPMLPFVAQPAGPAALTSPAVPGRWRAPRTRLYTGARRPAGQWSHRFALIVVARGPRTPRRWRSTRTKHGGDAVGTQDPHSHG